jgi:hypothetical protein
MYFAGSTAGCQREGKHASGTVPCDPDDLPSAGYWPQPPDTGRPLRSSHRRRGVLHHLPRDGVAPPSESSSYLHHDDEDEEYDWSPLQILNLESASTLIGDVVAAVRRQKPPLAPGRLGRCELRIV